MLDCSSLHFVKFALAPIFALAEAGIEATRFELRGVSGLTMLFTFDDVLVVAFQIPLEMRRKKNFVVVNVVDEGNRNRTGDRLRSSNWVVEAYHQYRHDDGNAG